MTAKPALPERVRSMEGLGVTLRGVLGFPNALPRQTLGPQLGAPIRQRDAIVPQTALVKSSEPR